MPLPLLARKNDGYLRRWAISFENRLFFSVLVSGLPGVLLGLLLLWSNAYSLFHKIEGSAAVLLFWVGLTSAARNRMVHSIRSLANVVSSLRTDDFSIRAKRVVAGDALGDLSLEINKLARLIEAEYLGTIEAGSLLRKVAFEVEAVILAFSPEGKLKLYNRAALPFLGVREEDIRGRTAAELGVQNLLEGPATETIGRFSGGLERRWIVRRAHFREEGVRHRLVMLSDASAVLRAEERLAWQKIVRVLSHEINNSLAPVKSIVRTLSKLSESKLSDSLRDNFLLGLDVIGSRTEALNRFLQSYAKLTRLPLPRRRPVSLKEMVNRVVHLEARLKIAVLTGPEIVINVDPDQLDQALINLTCNAVEGVLVLPEEERSSAAVTISWSVAGGQLDLRIRDCGIGLPDTSNLFVPFYTTKQTGTGIGLVLSRQIVEAHDGMLMIRNRQDARGCEVEIKIPSCVLNSADEPAARLPNAASR